MTAEGWIKIYRQLCNHELWLSEPFTRGQAWVDLLLLANHKDGFIRVRGLKIPVLRGQVGWSELKLSKRWKWSRSKVRRFLNELKIEQQIEQQINFKISIITIVNYDEYQQKEQQNEQQKDNRKTTERQQKDTNKNDKNDKNEKNNKNNKKEYAPLVALTEKEYQSLIEKFGEQLAKEKIEDLSLGKQSKGYKYSSDYAAILNWDRREQKKKQSKQEDLTQTTLDWLRGVN